MKWPQGRADSTPLVETERIMAIKDFLIYNSYRVPWGGFQIYPGYLVMEIKESQDMRRLRSTWSKNCIQTRVKVREGFRRKRREKEKKRQT